MKGPRSLRGRAVMSAGIVVFVGGSLIAVVTLIIVGGVSVRSIDDALRARISDVTAQLTANPPSSGDPIQLPPLDARDPVIIQVVGAHGVPIATTAGVAPSARICPPSSGPAGKAASVELSAPGLAGTFRVLTGSVTEKNQTLLVCAAGSVQHADAVRLAVLAVLALTIPAMTVLVCLLVSRQVGRALGAVSDLSREADRLRTLDEGRLSVPPTGDEVGDLAVTLNELLDRLHAQSHAARQFVADAGHELRTPLTSLRIALELAAPETGGPELGGREPERDTWTNEAMGDLDRLTALVDDLLALARADSRGLLQPVPVEVPEAVADELTMTARLREAVTVTSTGEPVVAFADPHALRRAVRNLLANAVQHATSRVELTTRLEGRWVVLEVNDDGPGIPARQLDAVFERFVRLDEARTRNDGGSGLGLAIVAAFAEQSGGDVTAFPGPGGRFVLRLPTGGQ